MKPSRLCVRISLVSLAYVTILATSWQTAWGQDKSVRPDVNKAFAQPNVNRFVERFEREGREVYDHRKQIISSCEVKPGMVVADIGAGTGLFTRMLAAQAGEKGRVFAVDISKEFVRHVELSCREAGLKNVKGVVCQADSANLPKNSVDLVFICDTYHHFEYPYKTMRSIYRALRPEGRLVLVDFHRQKGKSSKWIMDHVRASQEVFAEEIKLAGFEVESELDFMKTSYWMRFKKSARQLASGHTQDSLKTVSQLLQDGTATLIDVREKSEWDAGRLTEAKLVSLSQLRAQQGARPSKEMTQLLPADKIIYCHCRSGRRVLAAAKILREWGLDVRPLKAGFADLVEAGFTSAP